MAPADPPEFTEHSPAQVQPFAHQRLPSRGGFLICFALVLAWRRRLRGHLEVLTSLQHGPAHAGVLGGNGDHCTPVAPALGQAARPAADRILLGLVALHGSGQHGARAHDQQAAQVGVARLRDAPQSLFAARAVLPRHQAQPCAEAAPAGEVVVPGVNYSERSE